MSDRFHHTHPLNLLSFGVMMREVRHTLGDIDFAAEFELETIQAKVLDAGLKEHIKNRIRAAHSEKRKCYVELLEALQRQQHRQSCAASCCEGSLS